MTWQAVIWQAEAQLWVAMLAGEPGVCIPALSPLVPERCWAAW